MGEFISDVLPVGEEERIKFCKSSASGSGNIIEGFFNSVRWGIFPQFSSYLWQKKLPHLHKKFTIDVSLDTKVPIKFRKTLGPELQIRARFALA